MANRKVYARRIASTDPRGPARVRCLGPGKKEHTFLSEHPGERVCGRCRRLQPQLSRAERAVGAPGAAL